MTKQNETTFPEKLLEKQFEEAWVNYWYKIKPLSRRLTDSICEERKVCSEFFQSMVERGFVRGKK